VGIDMEMEQDKVVTEVSTISPLFTTNYHAHGHGYEYGYG
jgi:hypothetical protein